jgi:amidase
MGNSMVYKNTHELVDSIKSKETTSAEILENLLTQIKSKNSDINAVVTLDEERAMDKAKEADKLTEQGRSLGPLHGIPITIKDAYEVEGIISTGGDPNWKDNVPSKNAEAVQRLVDAGAIIFGKTNVPYHSADIQSYNDLYGVTNNPWDLERTPGGSSGGSAAALAAGMTPLELGSDIGGSIRTPAHFCGVFGHKPSYNIVSEVGHLPPPPGFVLTGNGLSVAGPLARSPEDLEIAMNILAAPQSQDEIAWNIKLPKPKVTNINKLKVAVWPEEKSAEVDEEINKLITDTADDLRSAGAKVETVAPPFSFDEVDDIYSKLVHPIMSAGGDKETLAMADTLAAELDDSDMSELAKITRGVSLRARDYVVNNARRHFIKQKWSKFFENYDVMLSPVCAVPAFKHNHDPLIERTINVNGKEKQYWHTTIWAGPVVTANLPSTSTPIGLTSSGLPVNLQIIGPYLHDLTCIEVAKMIRDLRGGFRIPPNFQ